MICTNITLPVFVVTLLASASLAVEAQTLKVGTIGTPPFVIHRESPPKGISVEIWQEIAEGEGWQYELIPQEGLQSSLDAVSTGELDVLIGPIGITATRFQNVVFTQPYFSADISLMVPQQPPTLWSKVKPLFQEALFYSLGALFLALFTVGNLLWLVEHKENTEQFPSDYPRGVGSGMWFSLVTLTTVGYGDKAPVTKAGKFIASVWMLITMVTASSLTAGLAAAFSISLSGETTEEFRRPEDIKDVPIAVVANTIGADWGKYYHANIVETNNFREAIQLLVDEEVNGVIFNIPFAEYYLQQNPKQPFKLVDFALASQNYGFVLPQESPIRRRLNVKLLQMQETGQVQAIKDKWYLQ